MLFYKKDVFIHATASPPESPTASAASINKM